jgi:hypothetical protein
MTPTSPSVQLGEMYVGLAKDAYKPVEVALSKKVA